MITRRHENTLLSSSRSSSSFVASSSLTPKNRLAKTQYALPHIPVKVDLYNRGPSEIKLDSLLIVFPHLTQFENFVNKVL